MRILILLMIILSIFMGIPTNLGWFTLYGSEFSPILMLKENTFPTYRLILWVLLLCSHLGVFSLFFITKKQYFNQLLFWFPFVFILLFVVFDSFTLLYLIPFIIFWIVTIIRAKKLKYENNK